MTHQVCRKLSVVSSIGTSQGVHDPFIVVHHVAVDTRGLRLSFGTVHVCGVGRVIHEMPNRPPLVGGTMQAAGGGRVNSLFPKRFSKSFSPALEIGFSRIQPGPIKSCGFDGEMHMRMRRRVWVRVCLERVQHHGVLIMGKFTCRKVAGGACTESGSVRVGMDRMR